MVRYTYLLPIEVAHIPCSLTRQWRVLWWHVDSISPHLMAMAASCIFVFRVLVPSRPWLIVVRVLLLRWLILIPVSTFCSGWMLIDLLAVALIVVCLITISLMRVHSTLRLALVHDAALARLDLMQANHGLGCKWIPTDGAVSSIICDVIGVIHEFSVRWTKWRRTHILCHMMDLIMRLVTTSWVLIVNLKPRWS